jgi:hypothetical protein
MLFATDMRKKDVKQIKKMREFCLDIGVTLKLIHILENQEDVDEKKLISFNKKLNGVRTCAGRCVCNADFIRSVTFYVSSRTIDVNIVC